MKPDTTADESAIPDPVATPRPMPRPMTPTPAAPAAGAAFEVRVFPLLALGGRPSSHVATVTDALRNQGFEVQIDTVPYEFQRGGNKMLRVERKPVPQANP